MRLARLDLERYGAFEGRSFEFRDGARLHVVYGPNEAGKSSALAAVCDLLFGFPERTDFAFRHATGDLRLGARLVASSGEEVSFRRRKGRTGTLVGDDDRPLRDDLLAPFLGGLSRQTFLRAFGLNAEALRAGAEELLASNGDGGASLFAAASGLSGVADLRNRLESEADALFSPQARVRPFNELTKRHDAATKVMREAALGASAWKRLNDEIATLDERHGALDARRAELITARARLERLSHAHDCAAEVAHVEAALAVYADTPDLPPARIAELSDRLAEARAAEEAAVRATSALDAAERDLAAVAVDEAALAAAGEIESLTRQSGAFAKFQQDLPRVRREADALDEALSRLAVRLGAADARAVEAGLPRDATRAELAALLKQGRALESAADIRGRALAGERERLASFAGAAEGAAVADPAVLREALSALAPALRALDRREELRAEHDREARALAAASGRLSPPVADLDRLSGRPLPGAEWIARARRERDGLAQDAARMEADAAAKHAETAKIAAEIARLAAGGAVASPETIRAARAARDADWAALRGDLLGFGPLDGAERAGRVASLDGAIAEADRLADRMTQDAARAAEIERLKRRSVELAAELAELAAAMEALAGKRRAFSEQWEAGWSASGVEPGEPEEMAAWRADALGLIARRETQLDRMERLARLDAVEAELRPEIDRIATSAGVAAALGEDAGQLARRIETRLGALAEAFQREAARAAQAAETRLRLAALEREEADGAAARGAWRTRFDGALDAIGLSGSVSIDAAEAALAAWGEAPGLLEQRAALRQRIRGMERDAASFSEGVGRLVEAFARDLADLPQAAATDRLSARLAQARAAAARRDDASGRLEDASKAAEAAQRAFEQAGLALDRAAAGVGDAADIAALLPRIEERGRLTAQLAERRDRMLRFSGGADAGTLAAELAGFDPDSAPAELDRLATEARRLDGESNVVYAELHAARARRDALGSAEAERAAAEARAAGAELSALARDWTVTKLASLLLGAAIERARAQDKSPVLSRAGQLFAMLTGGAFSGFAEDFENDALVLFGRRASGETAPVGGLSEGTRDQFYLALRLAALEDFAGRAEAAPFIGDDLFATFDDARAAHGLRVLAEVGERVQPILFTHHRSIVEAARRELGEAADVIEIDAVTL